MREKNVVARSPEPHEPASVCPPLKVTSKSISELAAVRRLAATAQPAVTNTAQPAVTNTAQPVLAKSAPPAAAKHRPISDGSRTRRLPRAKALTASAPQMQFVLPKLPKIPIAARRQTRRESVAAQLRREMPCWLASMLLHLLVVVVLGSLVAQPATRRYLVAIVASFSDVDEAPLEMTILNVDVPRDEGADEGNDSRQVLDDDKDPFADDAEQRRAQPPATVGLDGAIPSSLVPADATGRKPNDIVLAVPKEVGTETIATSLSEMPIGLAPRDTTRAPPPAVDQRRLDEIVDRFIAFDIGRLPGEAGRRAKRDFEALGPESIPALVRGLNKAALIRASCPIMVISHKLQSALSSNRDRSLLDYAVDNLGREVPTTAPYASQVKAIWEQWAAVARGTSIHGERIARELEDVRLERRVEAALSVARQRDKLGAGDRKHLGWLLAGALKSRDTDLRSAARQALISMAVGNDFGPAEGAPPGEVQKAVCQWCRHFDASRFDAHAQGLLDRGTSFEERDERSAAMRYYRRVMKEFTGSPAAAEANVRIRNIKNSPKAARP